MNCGKFHFDIISHFGRKKFFNSKYRKFQIDTLNNIINPSGDSRASSILRYFSYDGIDNEEWEAGLDVLSKSSFYYMPNYISYLLKKNEKKRHLLFKRIDEYFNKVDQKSIGIDNTGNYDKSFYAMIKGIRTGINYKDQSIPIFYCYNKFFNKVKAPFTKIDIGVLKKLYFSGENGKKTKCF